MTARGEDRVMAEQDLPRGRPAQRGFGPVKLPDVDVVVDDHGVEPVDAEPLRQIGDSIVVSQHPPAVGPFAIGDLSIDGFAPFEPVVITIHGPHIEPTKPRVGLLELEIESEIPLAVVRRVHAAVVEIVAEHQRQVTISQLAHLCHATTDLELIVRTRSSISENECDNLVIAAVIVGVDGRHGEPPRLGREVCRHTSNAARDEGSS